VEQPYSEVRKRIGLTIGKNFSRWSRGQVVKKNTKWGNREMGVFGFFEFGRKFEFETYRGEEWG